MSLPPNIETEPSRPVYGPPVILPRLNVEQQLEDPIPAAPEVVPFTRLTFQSFRNLADWEIYTARDDGSDESRVTNLGDYSLAPRYNRGLTRIVFASNEAGNYEIYTINPNGTGLTRLTNHSADDFAPAWSYDGTRIVFESERNGQSEIYVMNADGSGLTRLTNDPDYDGRPSWSPDGTKIAFVSRRTGGYRIYVMNADGTGQTMLSSQAYSNHPVWSPDGKRIAYDADAENDGWWDIWVMNANGSSQYRWYQTNSYTDAWVGSWSPDNEYIAFTRINWVYYQGNWYWSTAYLDAVTANGLNTVIRLNPNDTEWEPDWQTEDNQRPTSRVHSLPPVSPGLVPVSWSGTDHGPSGIRNYDIQVRQGTNGTWTNWWSGTTDTFAEYSGIGGQTYYFRLRARDRVYNLEDWPSVPDASTTIEAIPPTSFVNPLPAFSRAGEPITVTWGGYDSGGSIVAYYDVQFKIGNGTWQNWQTNTQATSAVFTNTNAGETVYFRCRARDSAQNIEAWPSGNGDTNSSFYVWSLTGLTQDNRESPLTGTSVQVSPSAMGTLPSNTQGQYTAYFSSTTTPYQVGWSKGGYSSLPSTPYQSDEDLTANVFVPPGDNLITDWGFETGNPTTFWSPRGTVTPTLLAYPTHTGQNALQLGALPFAPPQNLSNSSTPVSGLRILNGPNNTTHAFWAREGAAYYMARDLNGSWTTPQIISQAPANAQFYTPDMTLAPDGTLYVLWVQFVPGLGSLPYYTSRPPGGSWSIPQMVGNTPGYMALANDGRPQIAVDANNIIHVAWSNGFTNVVYFNYNGNTWSTFEYLHSTSWNRYLTDMVVDNNGNLHLLWWEGVAWSNGVELVRYAYRPPAGAWTVVQDNYMSSGAGGACPPPQLAVQNNVAHVLYCSTGSSIQYRTGSGGTLGVPQQISQANTLSHHPYLVAPTTGGLHVMWNANGALAYRYRSPSGVWSAIEQPFAANAMVGQPSFVFASGGELHAFWSAGESDVADIYYARRSANGNWTGPAIVAFTGEASQGPLAAGQGSDGLVHVLWNEAVSSINQVYLAKTRLISSNGDSTISQQVTIPAGMSNPTLSYLYQLSGATTGSGLMISLDNGSGPIVVMNTSQNQSAWTHDWLDLSSWAGQTVTVTFRTNEVIGGFPVWAFLDEITVGSAYSDLWVALSGPTFAGPGQTVQYSLTYGNRGGVDVAGGYVTVTLPAGLSYVSAIPAPITTVPLVWNIGPLPAGSGPFTIQLTLQTASVAPNPPTVNLTATIDGPFELEIGNNIATMPLLIERRLYLPLLTRQ